MFARSPWSRLVASVGLLTAWLGLLFFGWAGAGLVHVLLLLAALSFPWRVRGTGALDHERRTSELGADPRERSQAHQGEGGDQEATGSGERGREGT